MVPSINRIRRYGVRYDELDIERGGHMREHLGCSISEQFDRDLAAVACHFAVSDGKVAPEALALINDTLGLNLDEAALRERARLTSTTYAATRKTMAPGQPLGSVVTSGYCNCSICCGRWSGGPTASGVMPTENHTIAVDRSNPIVPMGTKIMMNGIEYTVEDTGGFAKFGVAFDVYYESHGDALQHGRQTWEAYIVDGANGGQSVRPSNANQPPSTTANAFFYVPSQSFAAAIAYDNYLYGETGNPHDSCAELLLMSMKTLCERILTCGGTNADTEAAHFTTLMRSIQNLLVEKLDAWEGEPRF